MDRRQHPTDSRALGADQNLDPKRPLQQLRPGVPPTASLDHDRDAARLLAHGFARVHCDDCGHDDVVAFSCKGRGLCPSCGAARMVDTAAWLCDAVIPEVPVRQWVLSLPY
jgi:hypothetical protein